MGFRWRKTMLGAGLGAGLMLLAVAAPVRSAVPNDPANPELIQGGRDLSSRLTVPVMISGSGPYHFVVDTAAERTVISRELAGRLALLPGQGVTVLSLSGYDRMETAIIPLLQLTASYRKISDLQAPLVGAVDLGAAGLLGIDSLKSKRVVMDFKAMRMTIVDARVASPDDGEIVVTARRKSGQLILVNAAADGQRVNVIIDTGSQVSIGNPALRAGLAARGKLGAVTPITITSVTGGQLIADYGMISRMQISGLHLNNIPVAFTDAEIFHRLDLDDRPALLLGMDVLRNFDRVSIDFANKSIRFLLPGEAWRTPPVVASVDRRAVG